MTQRSRAQISASASEKPRRSNPTRRQMARRSRCSPSEAMSDVVDAYVLAGERRVEYCLYNGGSNQRALFQYRTPGTRWQSPQLIGAARAAGFELLVIDRPGYGMTGREPGRRVVDVVADVRTVVHAVGWDRFAVWGGSGGAPHALAIAARLSHRVPACASVVGLAPHDAPGLDWYAGMSAGNVEEFLGRGTGRARLSPARRTAGSRCDRQHRRRRHPTRRRLPVARG
jgi:pimeloyl-ACP methyl ester carboxylesterase